MVRLSERGAVIALFTISTLGAAVGNLSQTAVNAMLSDIMAEFAMSVDLGQWLTTIYMLVLGITVPAATFVARRFTQRQHLFISLGLFAAGSLCACFAPSFWVLFIGRVLQAMSTGLLLPLMQTIAMTKFPAGRQATAMGIAGIALGFAPNIGPTIGGAFSYSTGWRGFFIVVLVLVALLAVATALLVRGGESDRSARFDALSFTLSALGFGGILLGLSQASSFSVASPFVWVPLILGAVFLFLFVRRQKRVEQPLINMDIFASAQYTRGFVALGLLHAAFMGVTLIAPLYVQNACGGTALDAGAVLLPGTVAALILNPVAGVLTDKFGVRPVVLCAGACMAVGSVLMVFLDETSPLWLVMVFQGIRAFGVSGLIGPLLSWSLAGLPGPIINDGSSFSVSARQACASFGTALMVFATVAAEGAAAAASAPALPYQLAFGVSAVFSVATFFYMLVRVK